MNVSVSRARPKCSAIATQEERAWLSFYQRAGKDPAIAAEILEQLDADQDMKRAHLALYLCCRESLRQQQARQERQQRIGQFVRGLFAALLFRTPKATGRAIARARDLAVACLPETVAEPAAAHVQRLTRDSKVSTRTVFKAPAAHPQADAAAAAPQVVKAGG